MFSRKHFILAAVLFCITVLFGIRFLQTANHEFLIYVGIVLAVSVFIAAAFRKVRYPFAYLLVRFGLIRLKVSRSEQAVNLFTQKPKRYNCAQAAAKAFERDDLLEPLKSCGGGKAPDGLCGALYAAVLISDEEQVKERFLKKIGDLECKAIRKKGKASCDDCVRCAAEILELTTGEN